MRPNVQGARRRGKLLTWKDEDGTPVDLTGAIITAIIINQRSGVAVASDGTFTLVTPLSGIFTWAFGVQDVATAGDYRVQFTATYADSRVERTFADTWVLYPALVVTP